jgi:hypothetical protein
MVEPPAIDPERNRAICGAIRSNGLPCRQNAGQGTDHVGYGHCKMHFGNTPSQVTWAAKQEIAEVIRLADRRDDATPEMVLLEEVTRGAGAVAYFDQLVAGIEDPVAPRSAVLIDLWNEQRKLLAAVSTAIVKAGLREREVRILEMQARQLADVFIAMVNDPSLQLTAEQKVAARAALAIQLRGLAQPAIDVTAS